MKVLASNPWTTWSFPPLVLACAVAAIGLFAQGWLRLRSRGRTDVASWGRAGVFVAGVSVITLAIVSPIDAVGESYLQSAHMLQHVLIADLGVALVVVALRGPLTVFFLPRDLLAPLARARWPRTALAWLLCPRVTVTLWLVVLVAWHVPVLYEAALRTRAVHDLQHVSFIAVGVLVWVLLLDPTRHGVSPYRWLVGSAAVGGGTAVPSGKESMEIEIRPCGPADALKRAEILDSHHLVLSQCVVDPSKGHIKHQLHFCVG